MHIPIIAPGQRRNRSRGRPVEVKRHGLPAAHSRHRRRDGCILAIHVHRAIVAYSTHDKTSHHIATRAARLNYRAHWSIRPIERHSAIDYGELGGILHGWANSLQLAGAGRHQLRLPPP